MRRSIRERNNVRRLGSLLYGTPYLCHRVEFIRRPLKSLASPTTLRGHAMGRSSGSRALHKETKMKAKRLRENRFPKSMFAAVVLGSRGPLCQRSAGRDPRASLPGGVLTLGWSHMWGWRGFREELARRGTTRARHLLHGRRRARGKSTPLPTGLQKLLRPNQISFSP